MYSVGCSGFEQPTLYIEMHKAMDKKAQKKISKFLSLVLRHKPETIGLQLDENGWASVDELLEKMNRPPYALSFEDLQLIVAENDKQRFIFSDDLKSIRANQGHSVSINLDLPEKTPPGLLYHGTAIQNLESIRKKGLVKGSRQHVHLSTDVETARQVGGRHGKPVVLTISAMNMYQSGVKFYQSENGVWLTDSVPVHFISFMEP